MAEVTSDGVYAILGCGPVGLMAILGARELGAETIYAIDALIRETNFTKNVQDLTFLSDLCSFNYRYSKIFN